MNLGGFRLGVVVGRGGMSSVYAATDAQGARCVVKVLDDEVAGDVAARARFEREAQITAAVDHPNVVRVVGADVAAARPWLALEYVGPDAESVLQRGAMTPRRACRIVAGVAEALDALAAQGLVHGDVKPANVLLGDDGRVVLTDFGAAVVQGEQESAAGQDSPVASLAYAAPEVIRGEAVDARSDVYALGCTLFRLLTAGRYPFAVDGGRAELARAHCEDAPPRISEVVAWASPELDEVIATAMAKSPADRFATAGQLAASASRAVEAPAVPAAGSVPQLAGRLSAPPRVRARVHPRVTVSAPVLSVRQRRGVVVGAGAVVAVIVALVWALLRPGAERGPAEADVSAGPVSTAAPAPSPSAAAAEDLAQLRRLIPRGYEPGVCAPAELVGGSGATAVLSCGANTDVAGPTSARYELMSSAAGVRPALEAVMASGSTVICPTNMQSPGFWWRLADPRQPAGTLWCGMRAGRPVVAWSTDAVRLVSSIEAADPAALPALYAWWTQHS